MVHKPYFEKYNPGSMRLLNKINIYHANMKDQNSDLQDSCKCQAGIAALTSALRKQRLDTCSKLRLGIQTQVRDPASVHKVKSKISTFGLYTHEHTYVQTHMHMFIPHT